MAVGALDVLLQTVAAAAAAVMTSINLAGAADARASRWHAQALPGILHPEPRFRAPSHFGPTRLIDAAQSYSYGGLSGPAKTALNTGNKVATGKTSHGGGPGEHMQFLASIS